MNQFPVLSGLDQRGRQVVLAVSVNGGVGKALLARYDSVRLTGDKSLVNGLSVLMSARCTGHSAHRRLPFPDAPFYQHSGCFYSASWLRIQFIRDGVRM